MALYNTTKSRDAGEVLSLELSRTASEQLGGSRVARFPQQRDSRAGGPEGMASSCATIPIGRVGTRKKSPTRHLLASPRARLVPGAC